MRGVNEKGNALRSVLKKQRRKMTGTQKIMLGFILIILTGACLLMLPFATRSGETTTFSGALFSSVSATCVTGLVVYDTWSHWSLFGQLVLLTEMQVGGLGFITISTFTMIILRRKIGLSRRALIQNSLSTLQIRGSVRLVRRIVLGTILFEGCGAILLSARFIPELGVLHGIYYGVFHSVSAFCNAGFDLMGRWEPYSSFCRFAGDPLVMLTISALVIIGGIGFLVWDDVYEHRWHLKRYHLHTKIALVTTAILLVGTTVWFMYLERDNLMAGMSGGERFLAGFFSAVTPRTAGFNSIDTASLTNGSLLLTIILMFIGGSPGSTAGGIKTATIAVITLCVLAYIFRQKDCVAFRSRIDDEAVKKASIVVFINLFLGLMGMLVIMTVQPLPLRDVFFEVFSAIGTAGMSTGVTRELGLLSRIVIMILMYFGRMGSLTFAMSFTEHRKASNIRFPKENVIIG